ncbi:oxidative stress survival, Svf1-like protein [Hygrophoropsis aurantiaca]|uniref:Oxidative stress survival, Svf1-like protein n=1 Tax=Hygrophoropsis aurantiaca TaxID=72124 RepID=A0ACB8AFG0_9AGAM|nr:oxidative stress survival, Svf1-like protein [Hygrophoropsis aurantiaca]
MFSSLFSTSPPTDPKASNFRPVSSAFPEPSDLFGELEPKDTEWTCASGFVTETSIFYNFLEDGTVIMCQVIHSSIGVWYPTIQFTCKIYNPNTGEKIWKSINVSNFVTPPPGLDKRSSKADEYSITYKATGDPLNPEMYAISAQLSDDLRISLDVTRPASVPGFKVGKGPKGGFSYFGSDVEKPEGYVVHRFWPRTHASCTIIRKDGHKQAQGPGMFVHAIQGMRPNLVAARWNFANFQSDAHGGVSAVQMEFTTTDAHGRRGAGSGGVAVNVGCIVLGGKLAVVTGETRWPDEKQKEESIVKSRAIHQHPIHDQDTGYSQPSEIDYRWSGPSIVGDAQGVIDASLHVDVGGPKNPKGLIEKVDVLAEIPYVIKTVVNYVAGTKPYIYQFLNKAKLTVRGPDALIPGLSGGLEIEGVVFNEATFIS